MIKRLELKGTPREIGRKTRARRGKRNSIQSETTKSCLFGYHRIRAWTEARERALVHLKAIEVYHSI